MELISVELSDTALRARSTRVSSSELALGRDPQPLERVVVHDTWSGEYYAGVIAAPDSEPDFEVQLGLRIPEGMALGRVTGMPGPTTPLSGGMVDDLMSQLRDVQLAAHEAQQEPRTGPAHRG